MDETFCSGTCVCHHMRELMMNKGQVRRSWTKPKLTRLGEIKDVAGAQTPVSQAVNVKS
jgi:hypothetical protein